MTDVSSRTFVPETPILFSQFRRRVTRTQRRRRFFETRILPPYWAARAHLGQARRWLRRLLSGSAR